MATKGQLSFNGLSAYLEDLAAAGQDVDAAAERALEAGAEPILNEMIRLVPKDTHNLEQHLDTDGPNRDGNFISIDIGIINADKDTAIYGNVQEYGSSSNAAQPYIRPALKGKKAAAMGAMKESLKAEGFTG
jgi:HK97 gp10 family phage protein